MEKNYTQSNHHVVSLHYQSFAKNLPLGLSSEKIVNCEILHFTTFPRILVFSRQKRFDNFTATQNIMQNHHNIKICKKDYSQGHFQKIQYFVKFRILQLLPESWYSALRRRLVNFTTAFFITQYHYDVKASQKTCSWHYLQKNL